MAGNSRFVAGIVALTLCLFASGQEGGGASAPAAKESTSAPTQAVYKFEKEKQEPNETPTHWPGGGVLGPVSLGPIVSVVGFPTLARGGIETRFLGFGGFAIDYGILPQFSISNIKLALNSFRVVAKLYPFQGAFYVGGGFGSQAFAGETDTTISGVPINIKVNIASTILTPQIGWLWGSQNGGFFYGMELGAQVVLSSSVAVETNALAAIKALSAYTDAENSIKTQGTTLAQTTLPFVSMIQFGYLF